jgi:phosphoglycerol transferase MdoB-like AlkP superfamily enzyme
MQLSHYHKRVLSKIILAILTSQVLRLIFLLFNYSKFSKFSFVDILQSFFYGQIFDNISIIYCCSVFLILILLPIPIRSSRWYQSITDLGLITGMILIIVLNMQDVFVFGVTKKRTGFDSLAFIDSDFAHLFQSYVMTYWQGVLMVFVMIGVFYKVVNKINQKYLLEKESWSLSKYGKATATFLLFIALLIVVGRGTQYRPIQAIDASRYVHPQIISLTLNTPMQMISTVQNQKPTIFSFYEDIYAENIVHPIKEKSNFPPNKMNVCIIIMESMSKEYIGHYNLHSHFTPFLDSLIPLSLSYEHSYANGVFSKHGIVSTIGGMPALLQDAFMNSPYQSNEVQSLGYYLQDFGYDCSFYHGGRNGTMNFDNFVKQSNFGNYFGKNEYIGKSADDDGLWGIKDEPYYQYWKKELDQKKGPFCSVIFTLSNHDPYMVPDEYKDKFKGGKLPIHKTVQYADYALKRFFEEASKSKWYHNTLFIITADHTSLTEDKAFINPCGRFAVPIIFFRPGDKIIADNMKTIAQIDIMPSVLDIVGYDKKYFAMGNSIFSPGKGYAYQYADNVYQIISDSNYISYNWEFKPTAINRYDERKTVDLSISNGLIETFQSHLQVFSKRMQKNEYNLSER